MKCSNSLQFVANILTIDNNIGRDCVSFRLRFNRLVVTGKTFERRALIANLLSKINQVITLYNIVSPLE